MAQHRNDACFDERPRVTVAEVQARVAAPVRVPRQLRRRLAAEQQKLQNTCSFLLQPT